jgi:threonine synthase
MYFQNAFGPEYGISPDENLANAPRLVIGEEEKNSLPEEDFTVRAAENVVGFLGLDKR